jgi:hypothetical protein
MTNDNQTPQAILTSLAGLQAVSNFAAVNDVRYYLNGVLIEASATVTRLVATDGKCLGVYDQSQENTIDSPVSFIFPLEIIKMLKVVHKAYDGVVITLARNSREQPELITGGTVQVHGGATIGWKAVGGQFPDYIRVLPRGALSNIPAQFDPALVQKFVKAAKTLTGKPHIVIGHNGSSGGVIDIGLDNFTSVIMPTRVDRIVETAGAKFLTRLA